MNMGFYIITRGGINRISVFFYHGVGLCAINISKDIQPCRAGFRTGAESPKAVSVKSFIIQKHVGAQQGVVICRPSINRADIKTVPSVVVKPGITVNLRRECVSVGFTKRGDGVKTDVGESTSAFGFYIHINLFKPVTGEFIRGGERALSNHIRAELRANIGQFTPGV